MVGDLHNRSIDHDVYPVNASFTISAFFFALPVPGSYFARPIVRAAFMFCVTHSWCGRQSPMTFSGSLGLPPWDRASRSCPSCIAAWQSGNSHRPPHRSLTTTRHRFLAGAADFRFWLTGCSFVRFSGFRLRCCHARNLSMSRFIPLCRFQFVVSMGLEIPICCR